VEVLLIVLLVVVVAGAGLWLVRSRTRSTVVEERPAPSRVTTSTTPTDMGLRSRLASTRHVLADRLAGAFRRDVLDADFWDDLTDSLVAADVGVTTATDVIEATRHRSPQTGEQAREALAGSLVAILDGKDRRLNYEGDPAVILVVGVNGSGKTTSIAKLAGSLKESGKTVVLGAADTFRAAAEAQLRTWADRVGVEVVGGDAGADPASVAFEAYHRGKAIEADVVIVDTAGRLQTKANLMEELAKVGRVLGREAGEIGEVLLVIDGTTGQNALAQARTFTEAIGVTGIMITKLDGTSRGGIAVAVERELGIPVKFIGVGEGMGDLVEFVPSDFVDALLGA
jgi:fused signal recognition particle receptor